MRPSLLILAATAGAALANSRRPTAVIAEGVVVGTTTSLPAATATIYKFLGIPFAQSPPERFGLPKPPSRFRGELDASQFKDACTQQFNCEFLITF
jgi:acetylcholinesterase